MAHFMNEGVQELVAAGSGPYGYDCQPLQLICEGEAGIRQTGFHKVCGLPHRSHIRAEVIQAVYQYIRIISVLRKEELYGPTAYCQCPVYHSYSISSQKMGIPKATVLM